MSPQQSNGLSPVNLAIGAGVSVFEVYVPFRAFSAESGRDLSRLSACADIPHLRLSPRCSCSRSFSPCRTTLGQPFEVLKTHMAANRHDSLREAIRKTTARGGIRGFYQGLIPWVRRALL